jgi:electron transfer flavoprotein beta subunit
MRLGVCVKITPDTDTRIRIQGDGIDPAGIKWVVGPYDLLAVEEAIATAEARQGEAISYTVGDESTVAVLRASVLALGAARSVVVDDPALRGTDSLGVARALAAAIRKDDLGALFCGKVAIDDDNVQVPAMVSELLGWPLVSRVTAFRTDGATFTATRALDGGVEEVVSGALPAVFTAERGLNTPRYAKLPAIMAAKKKPADIVTLGSLGLSAADVAPAVTTSQWALPPARAAGRVLTGEPDVVVAELVRALRDDAKVL